MRALRNVVIKEAIVHILEEDAGRKIISERTIPLKDNPNISIYFEDLITKASEDGAARAAVFTASKADGPLDLCRSMFKGSAAFTAGSKELSEVFYSLMQADHRIKDGDLVVCRFTADSASGRDFLAILKLLPVGAYRNVQKGQAGSGKMFVDLEVDPFIFLKDINVLQKVALVSQPPSANADPEVLILDKQYKHGEIAKFFKDFLDVALVRDPAELTLNLYTCLIHSLNNLRQTLTPELDQYLGMKIYEIFTGEGMALLTSRGRLDLYGWVEKLDVTPEVKNWLAKDLKNEFQRITSIKIDLSLVEKYIKRRSFSGQDDSTYHMPTSSYSDLVQSVRYVANKPGVPPYYEVVIHTSVWREETSR